MNQLVQPWMPLSSTLSAYRQEVQLIRSAV